MKKISIIIPAYNEEKTIEKVLKSVSLVKIHGYSKEVIVVNDASIDNTKNIVENFSKNKSFIKLINHEKNMGKGAGISTALKKITGQIAIIQDADLEYDPWEIPKLVRAYELNPGCAIFGSRQLNKKNGYSYISYLLGNKLLNFLTNLIYGIKITDMETCYKLLPASFFKKIRISSTGFEIEPEITAKLAMLGCKIIEVPISYKPRSIEEGKKINWVDGIWALSKLVSVRLFFKPNLKKI
jgi:glycosyltransferase involved in cell wall biosynthesis